MAFFMACISEEFSLLQSISLRLKNVVLVYVHLGQDFAVYCQ